MKPISDISPAVLRSTAIIRFQDCDPLQHLNNAKYFDYFFNAREDQVPKLYGLEIIDLISGGYKREGKRYLTVAVGCTGGKHRSVVLARELADRLAAAGVQTTVVNRDLGRE